MHSHYEYLKGVMEKLNSNINNERILYHGAAVDSLENINRNGFNRSYCGKNGNIVIGLKYFC
jgi:poly [ADP-ribose] polymerase 10/14/15